MRWPGRMYYTNSSGLPLATSCLVFCFVFILTYLDKETEIPFSDSFLYDLKFFTVLSSSLHSLFCEVLQPLLLDFLIKMSLALSSPFDTP